jgi:hypothetical protein
MAEMSTGLKDYLLGNGSLKAALADGYIHIYAFDGENTIPGPDDAVSTSGDYTLLATIYSNGGTSIEDGGLEFGTASGGVLQKASGETWDNSDAGNIATGDAAFFVHVASGEADGNSIGASTTAERIVGSVGTAGADLNLDDTSLTSGQTQQITYYSVTVG